MYKSFDKNAARLKRHLRSKVVGTSDCPRISIFRSNNGGNKEGAAKVGADLAEKAKKLGITKVVFDRSGYVYHGRVAALAEAAREAGLEF